MRVYNKNRLAAADGAAAAQVSAEPLQVIAAKRVGVNDNGDAGDAICDARLRPGHATWKGISSRNPNNWLKYQSANRCKLPVASAAGRNY